MSMRATSVLAGACVCAMASLAQAAPVLEDNFEYADNTAALAVWNSGVNVTRTSYTPNLKWTSPWVAVGTAPTITLPSKVGSFNNSHGYRNLPSTLSDDFVLNVKWIHTDNQRNGKIMLMDAAGQTGYAVRWTSANADQYLNAGFFEIFRFDRTAVDGAISAYNDMAGSTRLETVMSNHDGVTPFHAATGLTIDLDTGTKVGTIGAVEDPLFADVTLAWQKASGTFTLSVDGHTVGTRTDTTYSSFDRLYLTGNTSSLFDDLSVSVVPEPTLIAPALLGAAAVLRRRRRD